MCRPIENKNLHCEILFSLRRQVLQQTKIILPDKRGDTDLTYD